MSTTALGDLFSEMEGFFAYDQGSTDSGVQNDARRQQVAKLFDELPPETARVELSRWLREHYLSEESLEARYGWEDVLEFLKWIDEGSYR